jgi:hypothetical protein
MVPTTTTAAEKPSDWKDFYRKRAEAVTADTHIQEGFVLQNTFWGKPASECFTFLENRSDAFVLMFSEASGSIGFAHSFGAGNTIGQPVRRLALKGSTRGALPIEIASSNAIFAPVEGWVPAADVLWEYDSALEVVESPVGTVEVSLPSAMPLPSFLAPLALASASKRPADLFALFRGAIFDLSAKWALENPADGQDDKYVNPDLRNHCVSSILNYLWIAARPLVPNVRPTFMSLPLTVLDDPTPAVAAWVAGAIGRDLRPDPVTIAVENLPVAPVVAGDAASLATLVAGFTTAISTQKTDVKKGWDRVEASSQQMLRFAAAADAESVSPSPAPGMIEFLNQPTVPLATAWLESKIQVTVERPSYRLSPQLVTALFHGQLVVVVPPGGTPEPEGFSIFLAGCTSIRQASYVDPSRSDDLSLMLQQNSGDGTMNRKDVNDYLKGRGPTLPEDVSELHDHMRAYVALLHTPCSLLHLVRLIQPLLDHIHYSKDSYKACYKAHGLRFFACFLQRFENRVQRFLRKCKHATGDRDEIGPDEARLFNFEDWKNNIEMEEVDEFLRTKLSLRVSALTSPKRPAESAPAPAGASPNKRQHQGADHGTPVTNANVVTAWRVLPGENFYHVFVKKAHTCPKVNGVSACVNYHVRGTCHSLCARGATHKALSPDITNQFAKWVKERRESPHRDA